MCGLGNILPDPLLCQVGMIPPLKSLYNLQEGRISFLRATAMIPRLLFTSVTTGWQQRKACVCKANPNPKLSSGLRAAEFLGPKWGVSL